MDNFILLLFSFALSALSIPVILYLSNRFNLYDEVNDRKIHSQKISRLGGAAIFLGFVIPFYLVVLPQAELKFNIYLYSLGLLIAFGAGFVDDLVNIRAWYKLILQIAAAICVAASGLAITQLKVFTLGYIHFGYFSAVLTVFWIIGFMNAVNLLDGMDGLASGIVFIATLFIFVLAVLQKNPLVAMIAVSLGGAILGFYVFNFPPARIFMGDGGAYFLGFMYSTMALMDIKKSSVTTIFLIPLILLIVPIYDILSVMIKRYKLGYNIFIADKNHLHHRMLSLGFSQRGILLVLYAYTSILGLLSILLLYIPPELTLVLFLLVLLLVFVSMYILNAAERIIDEKFQEIPVDEGKSDKGKSSKK